MYLALESKLKVRVPDTLVTTSGFWAVQSTNTTKLFCFEKLTFMHKYFNNK